MSVFKKLLCLMVSCVFISMVCIPAAHADATGSIDLNVQASPRMKARDGGAEVHNARKFHNNTYFKFKYCLKVINKTTGKPVSNVEYSAGSMSLKASEPNYVLLDFNENNPGTYCYSFNGKNTAADWNHWNENINETNGGLFNAWHVVNGEWKSEYGEAPNIWCQMNEYYGYLVSCHGDDDKKDNVELDSTGIVSTVYLKPIKPEHQILSSFPMTGKYTLSTVISMIVIAGITIIFIHRYGRKYNG